MSKSCGLEQIWDQLVQSLDSLATIFDSLKQILPALQNSCSDLLRFEEFGSVGVNLRREHDESSRQLHKIACDVVEFIIIAKSLREMADDENQMERIRAEIRKQRERGTTHFDRQDIVRFPELNEFLTELLQRVGKIDFLSGKIERQSREHYSNFSGRNQWAETKATSKESSAWLRKIAFGTAAVALFGVATGGIGLGIGAAIAGAQGTAMGLTTLAAVGGGGGYATGNISRIYSHQEAKFRKAKQGFESLDRAAFRLQQVTGEIQRYTQLFKTNIEACFIRDQPPLLRQIPRSLEKLFTALRFEGVNFNELKMRAQSIVEVTATGL